MSEFKKLLDHPEHDKLIGKLVNGESAKQVSDYLKLKYNKPEEKHLKLPSTLLQDFIDKYLNQYNFLNKLLEDEKTGKIDSKVSQSLLENKPWRDRIAALADDQIDLKKKILQVLTIVETRAEQIFDKIQENPRVTRDDYVLIKYFENLCQMIEKADKLINERPDQTIQHNVTVQMVEQHSVAFQEAIRDLLKELDPEISARFMELLTEKLGKMHGSEYGLPDARPISQMSMEKKKAEAEKLLPKFFKNEQDELPGDEPEFAEELEAEFVDSEGTHD